MKKLLNLGIAILMITFFSSAGCEKETITNEQELPAAAKQFLSTHFSAESVTKVIEDKEGSSITYEVTLANGTDIDFDKEGKCISMDGHGKKIPDSVLPSNILTYVQTNYQDNIITDWELEPFGQKIELSGDIELGFDKEGNFLRVI